MTRPTDDDHLPPAPPPQQARDKAKVSSQPAVMPVAVRSRAADRMLFGVVGVVIGFALGFLATEKLSPGPGTPPPGDPHAGLGIDAPAGAGAKAGGDAAPGGGISASPEMRQRARELEAQVAKSPSDATLLVGLGNTYYDMQDYRSAADVYERAVKLDPGDPNVLTDLGVSYRMLGEPTKAIASFQRALKVRPDHWQALFNQVIVYGFDRSDFAKAREVMRELKKTHGELKKTHPELPDLDKLEKELEARAAQGAAKG